MLAFARCGTEGLSPFWARAKLFAFALGAFADGPAVHRKRDDRTGTIALEGRPLPMRSRVA